jgi:ketosteroid isomerase-like protein
MRWCSLVGVLVLGACGTPQPTATVVDLMDADRAFAIATAEQGTAGWVSFFADDGTMFRGGKPVVGHDAIRALMAPALDNDAYSLTWAPEAGEIAVSGDLGYTRGRWESRSTGQDGAVSVRTGSYVTIWKKVADGSWKVTLDIGNPDDE